MMLLTAGTTYMDSETSEAFAKVLEYIVNGLGKAVEDNGASVMEYVKELGSKIVAYKAGISWLWMIAAALCLVFAIAFFITALVKDEGGFMIAAVIAFGIAVTIAMISGYKLIECYTFPEKTILDYITSEYNSMKSGTYR